MSRMRISAKGRVTIPASIRQQSGLLPNTEVDVRYDGVVVTIVPAGARISRGRQLVQHLRAHPGDISMTTDEIVALMRDE
jgi:AbrB family looped-hinge helix DNA binding protein